MVKLWEKLNQVHRTQVKYSLVASNWGGLTFPKDRLENVIGNSQIILYINTNDYPVSFILDDNIEEVVAANSVWFINTHPSHFLNMTVKENVYMYIFADDSMLPMERHSANSAIPTDMAGSNGVIIIISAQ